MQLQPLSVAKRKVVDTSNCRTRFLLRKQIIDLLCSCMSARTVSQLLVPTSHNLQAVSWFVGSAGVQSNGCKVVYRGFARQ